MSLAATSEPSQRSAPDPFTIAADILDPPPDPDIDAREAAIVPLQRKQQTAEDLAAQAVELLYGGAAGGGKTFWLIEHFRRQMEDHPNNRGVIFRRVFPSLRKTVLPRALEVFAGRARYNANDHTFTFPNGSVLELAGLQHADKSHFAYAGTEYGCIGFEELTEFDEQQVDFMLSRLRAPGPGIRPHMVATTNPGGRGHKWVKRRYIRPKPVDVDPDGPEPGPLMVWRPRPTEDRPRPLLRCFVPAQLADNPELLRRDPGYPDKLASIANRGLRRALATGDWDAIDAVEGAMVEQPWLDAGRIAAHQAPMPLRRGVAVDPSDGLDDGDEFGIAAGFLAEDRHAYTDLVIGIRGTPAQMARRAIGIYHETKADFLAIEKNHGGAWLLSVFRQIDPTVNYVIVHASEGKRTRAEPALALFEPPPGAPWGLARLVGDHEAFEDQATSWTGAPGEDSPNELDAWVWLMHELVVKRGGHQGVIGEYEDTRLAGRR